MKKVTLRRLLSFKVHFYAILAFVILIFSVSTQSIDMDEAQTWDYARLHSATEVWAELRVDPNSESQMPLGMFAAWAWARIFGTSEVAMRSLNLLWVGVAIAALARVAKQISIPWLPMLFAIQPFVWYSMDHARTPLMQMAGGSLLLACAAEVFAATPRWLTAVLLSSSGAIILCGASMLGVVPLIVFAASILVLARWKKMGLPKAAKITLVLTFGILVLLGLYYISTLIRGAGGVKLWVVSPINVVFVAYEFLGYVGLGPGRQELRDSIRSMAALPFFWIYMIGWLALTGAYAAVAGAAIKSWFTRLECSPTSAMPYLWVLCASVSLVSAALLYCLATAVGFPFWGRHLAGTVPFVVAAIGGLIHWSLEGIWRRLGRVGASALVFLLVVACVFIRLAPFHRHDNYRAAVTAATRLSADGAQIWWAADKSGAEFYGLKFSDVRSGVNYAPNRTEVPDDLPNVLIISRPEAFDQFGIASKIAHSGSYKRSAKFQAFEIWERDGVIPED